MKKAPWASDLPLQEVQLIDVAWGVGILKLDVSKLTHGLRNF